MSSRRCVDDAPDPDGSSVWNEDVWVKLELPEQTGCSTGRQADGVKIRPSTIDADLICLTDGLAPTMVHGVVFVRGKLSGSLH